MQTDELIRVYALLEKAIYVDGQPPIMAFSSLSVTDKTFLEDLYKALGDPHFRVKIVQKAPQAALYTLQIKSNISEYLSL